VVIIATIPPVGREVEKNDQCEIPPVRETHRTFFRSIERTVPDDVNDVSQLFRDHRGDVLQKIDSQFSQTRLPLFMAAGGALITQLA